MRMITRSNGTLTRLQLLLAASLACVACASDSGGGEAETGSSSGEPATGSSTSTSSGSTTAVTTGSESTTTGTSSSSSGTQTDSSESGSSTGVGVDCRDRPTARPSVRSEIDGVWDAARGAMIMFGGDEGIPVTCMSQTDFGAETWAYHPDCDNFELLDDAGGPSARGRYASALDPVGDRMLVHGGRSRDGTSGTYTLYDDTWAFDLTTETWEQLATGGPSPRTNHVAVIADNQFIVYGGNASTNGAAFTPLGDTWALDLASGEWAELQTTGDPSPRLFHAAALSQDEGTMFVYGGGDASAFTGPFFSELYTLDMGTGAWTLLHDGSGTAPVGSIWGDLLLDSAANRLLLWGAHEDNLLGNNNKIWQFDLEDESWTMLEEGDVLDNGSASFCDFPVDFVAYEEGTPERRSAGAAVITDDSELLVFGGKTDCGLVDDVWSWPLAGGPWDNRVRATQGEICLRAFAEGCTSMCI